jgi:hypothetical protein
VSYEYPGFFCGGCRNTYRFFVRRTIIVWLKVYTGRSYQEIWVLGNRLTLPVHQDSSSGDAWDDVLTKDCRSIGLRQMDQRAREELSWARGVDRVRPAALVLASSILVKHRAVQVFGSRRIQRRFP